MSRSRWFNAFRRAAAGLVLSLAAGCAIANTVSLTSTPRLGPPGTPVVIDGRGFGATKGEVFLGATPVRVLQWSPQRVVAEVPETPGAADDTWRVVPQGVSRVWTAPVRWLHIPRDNNWPLKGQALATTGVDLTIGNDAENLVLRMTVPPKALLIGQDTTLKSSFWSWAAIVDATMTKPLNDKGAAVVLVIDVDLGTLPALHKGLTNLAIANFDPALYAKGVAFYLDYWDQNTSRWARASQGSVSALADGTTGPIVFSDPVPGLSGIVRTGRYAIYTLNERPAATAK